MMTVSICGTFTEPEDTLLLMHCGNCDKPNVVGVTSLVKLVRSMKSPIKSGGGTDEILFRNSF